MIGGVFAVVVRKGESKNVNDEIITLHDISPHKRLLKEEKLSILFFSKDIHGKESEPIIAIQLLKKTIYKTMYFLYKIMYSKAYMHGL